MQSIDKDLISNHVVKPVMELLNFCKTDRDRRTERLLMLGTCAQESLMGKYLKQIRGPALSMWMIEPATHDDNWENYISHRPRLKYKMNKLLGDGYHSYTDNLTNNYWYACAIARVKYYRADFKMEYIMSIEDLATVWKKYYNSPKGKGTEKEFIENYKRYVMEQF